MWLTDSEMFWRTEMIEHNSLEINKISLVWLGELDKVGMISGEQFVFLFKQPLVHL